MSLALPSRLARSRNVQMLCAALALMAAAIVISSFHRRPRPWAVGEVPIAFWSWRNQTPAERDVRAAIEKTKAQAIFLHAGQIDFRNGQLSRIRPVSSSFPRGIRLHLVYNATHALLNQLEAVDEKLLAQTISTAFNEDFERAGADDARVVGLQIDIDVPTRLLARYERTLRALRARVPRNIELSITGLPTWMQSSELHSTLKQVEFWVPQFYGAEIPLRADQAIPISSTPNVELFINKAREFNKPFYAGLAAYSYALLYSSSGALVSLRGDLDPSAIATDANLELTDRRLFPNGSGEWRYAYRARADGVTDGLAMHAGDLLVVDVPSAESLRAAARIVRRLAGEKLLGICVFRLPAADDPATLTIEQVVTALADHDSAPDLRIKFKADQKQPNTWSIEVRNEGTSAAVNGLKIDLPLNSSGVQSVSAARGVSVETFCRFSDDSRIIEQPCGQNRANVICIVSQGLRPGQTLKASLVMKSAVTEFPPASIETQTGAGLPYLGQIQIQVEGGEGQ